MFKLFKVIIIIPILVLTSCTASKTLKTSTSNNLTLKDERSPIVAVSREKSSLVKLLDKSKSKHCYISCPTINPGINQLIDQGNFIVNYNLNTKYADWVAYKIDKNNISGSFKKRTWKADPQINKDLALIPSDYKNANLTCNYDRGHQAPLADFSNSENAYKTNYLSNITPQKAELNQGPWNDLEKKIRNISSESENDLYVITGTYYNGKPVCKLPYARIDNLIPNGYWKVITLVANNNVYSASFKFEQDTPKDANFCDYKINTHDLSKLFTYSLKHNSSNENSEVLLNMLGCTK